MIPLKIPHLLRCFNFPAHATYAKYASFLENFAPCISGFLSGIIFQDFCSVIIHDKFSINSCLITLQKVLFIFMELT
jgi:hypothetical protein